MQECPHEDSPLQALKERAQPWAQKARQQLLRLHEAQAEMEHEQPAQAEPGHQVRQVPALQAEVGTPRAESQAEVSTPRAKAWQRDHQ